MSEERGPPPVQLSARAASGSAPHNGWPRKSGVFGGKSGFGGHRNAAGRGCDTRGTGGRQRPGPAADKGGACLQPGSSRGPADSELCPGGWQEARGAREIPEAGGIPRPGSVGLTDCCPDPRVRGSFRGAALQSLKPDPGRVPRFSVKNENKPAEG